MQKELMEALKTITTCCTNNNNCDICPLMYWCDNEFGMTTPNKWWLPTEEE